MPSSCCADGFLPKSQPLRNGSPTVTKTERCSCTKISSTASGTASGTAFASDAGTASASDTGTAAGAVTTAVPDARGWCLRNITVPNTLAPALGARYNLASRSYTLVSVANANMPGLNTYVKWFKGSGAVGLMQLKVAGHRGVTQCLTLPKTTATMVSAGRLVIPGCIQGAFGAGAMQAAKALGCHGQAY